MPEADVSTTSNIEWEFHCEVPPAGLLASSFTQDMNREPHRALEYRRGSQALVGGLALNSNLGFTENLVAIVMFIWPREVMSRPKLPLRRTNSGGPRHRRSRQQYVTDYHRRGYDWANGGIRDGSAGTAIKARHQATSGLRAMLPPECVHRLLL